MSNPSWPSTLPDPTVDTAQYAPLIDNVIRTSMETGAPKTRRRFTYVPDVLTCTLTLTGTQRTTLDTFVATTLKDVLPFDWLDFRDGSAATYVFQKRPTYQFVQGSRTPAQPYGLWRAQLELMRK